MDRFSTCPEDYIYSEIPGINLIHHNEICNFLLKPGDLLIDRPNFILREITRFKGIDNSTIKRVNKLYEIVKEIKTYTYKPRNGTGTVVRFQMYGRDKNKLLQTLSNLDFDKTGTVVEPWCQLKADKDAVSAASIRKSKWEAASFSNSDANNLKLEKTAPTRLVNRNLHRR